MHGGKKGKAGEGLSEKVTAIYYSIEAIHQSYIILKGGGLWANSKRLYH